MAVGTTVGWADTVIGVANGTRTGDLAKYVPSLGKPVVMIAKGCLTPDDGGGGAFFWSKKCTLVDDGGTVIRPNSVTPATPGRWLRIYEGPLNVCWFGAQGTSGANDQPAFQKAIDACMAPKTGETRGGTVHVPRGQYIINSSLILPRGGTNGASLAMVGDGSRVSSIVCNGGVPVIDFDPLPSEYSLSYRFAHIQFRRTDSGTVFRHVPKETAFGQITDSRLLYATFEDVWFSALPAGGDASEVPLVQLFLMMNSVLENISLIGGGVSLEISRNRNRLEAIHTFQDYGQHSGIVLRGSENVLDNVRVDGLQGSAGDGILLDGTAIWNGVALGPCQRTTIRNASFEGKGGRSCIRLQAAEHTIIENTEVGGTPNAAIWIDGASRHLQVTGGFANINVPGTVALRADAGAQSLRVSNLGYSGGISGVVNAPGALLMIDPSVSDVVIDVVTAFPERAQYAQITGPATFRGNILLFDRWEHLRIIDQPAPITFDDIKQGSPLDGPGIIPASPGRRVSLFFQSTNVTVGNGGTIRLRSGVAWTPLVPSVLELVFDGTWWWETARNPQ
jgi:Pectate lyase superfamily protein